MRLNVNRCAVAAAMAIFFTTGGWVLVGSGQTQAPTPPHGVLAEPMGARGQAIFPAFEGWGPLKDGSTAFLLGYFNRNREEEPDIPIGPNNRIEPGGPDYGQPTHFHKSRQYGVFAIVVPKDFGTKRLTWTLTSNGHTSTISFWTNPPYWVDFYLHGASGNEPPVIKFSPAGREITGPPREKLDLTLNGVVGQPVPLSLWAADQPPTIPAPAPAGAGRGGNQVAAGRGRGAADAAGRGAPAARDMPAVIGGTVFDGARGFGGGGGGGGRGSTPRGDITVIWKKYRGPGAVRIGDEAVALVNNGDAKRFLEAKTTATFSAPGEYWLRAQVNDGSGDGGGGDLCCWTTAHVRVLVSQGSTQ